MSLIHILSGERIRTVPLLGGYAVVNLPEEEIQEFASRPQIEFVEIPKRLYFQVNQALDAACIRPVQEGYFPGAVQTGNTAVSYTHLDVYKRQVETA